MKSNDRTILVGLALVGLLAAFWFLFLGPKRAEVADLDKQIVELETSVAAQEQLAASAEQAREGYDDAYQRLVVFGKAVPTGADAPSLIEQTSTLAKRTGIDFRAIVLGEGGGVAPPAPPVVAETPAEGAPAGDEAPAPAAAPAAATEASAASLPIGATIGSAGLPVMPYDLSFSGDFFEVADFMAGLDSLVRPAAGRRSANQNVDAIGVDGRLLTVNGFTLKPEVEGSDQVLSVEMNVTSYVAPADQGLTGGATPAAPAPAIAAPVSSTATTTPTAP